MKRLDEVATLEWALQLSSNHRVERLALIDVLNRPKDDGLDKAWMTAWRLIEESWADEWDDDPELSIYHIQRRLQAGDRSGSIISQICNLVAPRLEVSLVQIHSSRRRQKTNLRLTTAHKLGAQLRSGKLVNLELLALDDIFEEDFLQELVNGLDAVLQRGINITRRTDCHPGSMKCAYYVTEPGENGDPDAFNEGCAPCTKLLHAVVLRLAAVNPEKTKDIIARWRFCRSPIYIRLWAAIALNSTLVAQNIISEFLENIDSADFWDVYGLPEVIELRTKKFASLTDEAQRATLKKIIEGPLQNNWYSRPTGDELKAAKRFWSARELKRLSLAGVVLPESPQLLLNKALVEFPELEELTTSSLYAEGFKIRAREANPNPQYDDLDGTNRLLALETALKTERSWDSDPSSGALDWMRVPGNSTLVLSDFELDDAAGNAFPQTWSAFAWAHVSTGKQSVKILQLIQKLTDKTITEAIDALTHWFSCQDKSVIGSKNGLLVWHRLWPLAVEVTNKNVADKADVAFDAAFSVAEDDGRASNLDTLNNPAGRLVGCFLQLCPSLKATHRGNWPAGAAKVMRDVIMRATGASMLIARHRLITGIGYFLKADPSWAEKALISTLRANDDDALVLWQAVAQRTLWKDALAQIGNEVLERISDKRLPRRTRESLLFSLVIESMHAFREKRAPSVANVKVTQVLRTIEDGLRASAANAIQRFVRDVDVDEPRADIFETAAKPFLENVWPKERSLTSSSISAGLSDLPATANDAFPDAVETIARFLIPFDCWSMLDYGLYGEEKQAFIDTPDKAKAFLKLLDLTVGEAKTSVIPYDLSEALASIEIANVNLRNDTRFKRLAAAARR